MKTIRRSQDRGQVQQGWLHAKHSFSFASYYHPEHMGFSDLRVINQDIIAPGGGFATHSHNDMEIITYPIRGALSHVDSLGQKKTLHSGEIQVMSAGTGISHSEMNDGSEEVELLQIWIQPDAPGHAPSYSEMRLDDLPSQGELRALVRPRSVNKPGLPMNQDAWLFEGRLSQGQSCDYALAEQRSLWLQLVAGQLALDSGEELFAGDGLAVSGEKGLKLVQRGAEPAVFLLFDLKG